MARGTHGEGSATSLLTAVDPAVHPEQIVHRLVTMTRERLGLEVSFVSEFSGGQRLFRFVDGDTASFDIEVGAGDPLEETYCHHIATGALVGLIPDTDADPFTRDMDVTADRGIGAYVGVPVVFSDGRVFGTFCAASHHAEPGLAPRDLEFLRIAAALVAEQLERETARDEHAADVVEVTRAAIRGQGLTIVYQPIIELDQGGVVGVEALSRFTAEPYQPPDRWFARAWGVGLGAPLELAAVRQALDDLPALGPGLRMHLNISPETLLLDEAVELLTSTAEDRLVVELTEHAPIHGQPVLRDRLEQLRARGVRCALDDMGTGYAGLTALVELRPHVHKIDRSIVHGVDEDRSRSALIAAWVAFAGVAGAMVVAEGIETESELAALRILNVPYGQGYHLGRPAPIGQLSL